MQTLDDSMRQARKAAGPDAVRCLREADPLLESASGWTRSPIAERHAATP
jgi:hypothetical protein